MKTAGWMVAVLVAAGGLTLGGCATNGGVNYAPGAAPSAQAVSTPAKVVTGISDKSSFEAVRGAIEQGMQPHGRFESVAAAGRATVNGRLQDMATLFDQYGSIDKMTPAALAQITDDQNAINAVLAPQDGNRRICTLETHVGSHFPTRVCHTLSELRNQNNYTQQALRDLQNRPVQMRQNKEGGGGGGPV